MIEITAIAFSESDKKTLHDWINQPGRLLYQKLLSSQAAAKMAEAVNERVRNDQNAAVDAEILESEARVIVAARKMLDEIMAKETIFQTVELKPEQSIKNP